MKKKSSFIILYDPYSQKINDTFDEKLKRYIEDNGKTITIENTTYNKAFEIIQLGNNKTIAALNNQMNLKINDTIINNHGNEYIVDGFEMIRLLSETFPEWYKILSYVKIKGTLKISANILPKVFFNKNQNQNIPKKLPSECNSFCRQLVFSEGNNYFFECSSVRLHQPQQRKQIQGIQQTQIYSGVIRQFLDHKTICTHKAHFFVHRSALI